MNGTSYLHHDLVIASEMAYAMMTDLLFTFHRCQFPPLSSAHRVQNGMFNDDGTIVYIIAYKLTNEI